MAWALKPPMGQGIYFVFGYTTKWRALLEERFDNEFTDAERERYYNRAIIYKCELIDRIKMNGAPLRPDERPTSFESEKFLSQLASMIELTNEVIAVDDDVKDVINLVEPGVHEFLPIDINMPRDRVYPKKYNILVVRHRLEAFMLIDGTYSHKEGDVTFYPLDYNKTGYQKVCVSKQVIGKAHLWRDTRMTTPNVFMSDVLQAAIAERGLQIFRHHKVKEI